MKTGGQTVQDERHPTMVKLDTRKLTLVVGGILLAAAVTALLVFRIDLSSFGFLAVMALCPLMHVFMMRGHNHGGQGASCHSQPSETVPAARQPADPLAGSTAEGPQLSGRISPN